MVIITQMSDISLTLVPVSVAHHLPIIGHDQSSIHHSSFIIFSHNMNDPRIDHHATVPDRKMTCTIVFRGTKGGVDK